MFLAHYILPFVIYCFRKNKTMLYGLLMGNLIDLDHIYMRVIGKVGWFESACSSFGDQCSSFGFYPLHSPLVFAMLFFMAIWLYGNRIYSLDGTSNKKRRLWFWIMIGAMLNLILDYIHLITGWYL